MTHYICAEETNVTIVEIYYSRHIVKFCKSQAAAPSEKNHQNSSTAFEVILLTARVPDKQANAR